MTTFTDLTPQTFTTSSWSDILPLYDELAGRALDGAEPVALDNWLRDWHALDTSLIETSLLADFVYSGDIADPEKEEAYLRFSGEIGPRHQEQVVRLATRLIETGYTRPDLEMAITRFRTGRDIFREESIPLEQDLQRLNARYNKVTGGMTVKWEGEEVPLPRLNPFILDPDRDVRERAWRLQFRPYIDQRDELADIFDAQLAARQRLARNAGFENYRDYMFKSLHRYDYTPEDCETFHASVEQTFVPATLRHLERRKIRMDRTTLRPWDIAPDPYGRPALRPFESVDHLNAMAQNVFTKVDPVFGEYFGAMRREEVLDLDSRTGKRPGGFCDTFPYRGLPFIFMNASGVGNDIQVLAHEAGHAFHGFEASALPFFHAWHPGEEMAEVASMAMELLAGPYLSKLEGGFYDDDDFRRARIEHLDGILTRFAWISVVDAFQHWLYTDPAAADRDARDAKFVEIWERFEPGLDWTGLEAERSARWHRQLHIFLYPFYYIEYAIAQLGALQVWRNSLRDQAKATADYRAALALGGSCPLPELFGRAGARLIFNAEGMQEMVSVIESELEKLNSPAF